MLKPCVQKLVAWKEGVCCSVGKAVRFITKVVVAAALPKHVSGYSSLAPKCVGMTIVYAMIEIVEVWTQN